MSERKRLKITGRRKKILDISISDITLRRALVAGEKAFLLRMSGKLHKWLKDNVRDMTINEFILSSIERKIEGIEGAEPPPAPNHERPTVSPKEAAELEFRYQLAALEVLRIAAESGRWPLKSEAAEAEFDAFRATCAARFRKGNASDEEWLEYEEELNRLKAELGFDIEEKKEELGRKYTLKYREIEEKKKNAA